jgi:MFS family permease
MNDNISSQSSLLDGFHIRKGSFLILSFFFLTHGIFHFMSHSFAVMLPAVKDTFSITPVQVGAIITVKELAGGLVALPGGVLSDYLRQYRMLLMAVCMVIFAAGWFVIGYSHFYGLLLVGMVIIAVASSIWHLPSIAELGQLFSHNRGAVLAVHGAGGSVGDILGPVMTGLLLSVMSWRGIISTYAAIPLMMSLWAAGMFLKSGKTNLVAANPALNKKTDLKTQLKTTRDILKRTHIWRVNLVAGFRGMCFVVIITFLPLFMKEDLGFSSKSIGFHFGLLWTIGIIASPMMGHFSDKWGRKLVLVPALVYSSTLLILLALFGKGIIFTIIIGLLGVSIRSDYSLVNATILDITGDQVATTMLGVLSVTRFLMGALSPLIAGGIYQYAGMKVTLLFVAALFFSSAVIFSSIDLSQRPAVKRAA